jgi:RNA polymerase sigma-70 factor, ECF subfamily
LTDREQQWRIYLEQIADGNAEALTQLYRETVTVLYSIALRMLGNQADAEEVVLEVYEQVWRTAHRYDSDRSRILGWLSMQTRSRVLDRLRSSKRRHEMEAPIPEAFDAAGAEPLADDTIVFGEQRQRVRQALAGLPPEQRQALELAYFSDLSHSEIAAKLGTPLGTIKSRIRAALHCLRVTLGDAGETVAEQTA